MHALEVILILLGLLALVFGFFQLSEATLGVGGIAIACFLGILARLAQAARHQDELLSQIGRNTTSQSGSQ